MGWCRPMPPRPASSDKPTPAAQVAPPAASAVSSKEAMEAAAHRGYMTGIKHGLI